MQEEVQKIWGDILQDAVKQAANMNIPKEGEVRSTVSKIALMVPWLLQSQDFSNLVTDLKYLRNPELLSNEELKPMLERIENAVPANNNTVPTIQTKRAA